MRKTLSLFIAIVLILVTLGILILASASSTERDDAGYFVKRQLMWLAFSFCAAAFAARFDYRHYQKLAIPLAAFSVILLILVRIPGIGTQINGSWRWLRLGQWLQTTRWRRPGRGNQRSPPPVWRWSSSVHPWTWRPGVLLSERGNRPR